MKSKDLRLIVQHLCAYHNLILANGIETSRRFKIPESATLMLQGIHITVKEIQKNILKICASRGLNSIQTKIIFQEHIHTNMYLQFLELVNDGKSSEASDHPTSPYQLHRADASGSGAHDPSGGDQGVHTS